MIEVNAGDKSFAVRGPVQPTVVDYNRVAISRQLNVKLHAVRAKRNRKLERRQGVLGRTPRGSAMRYHEGSLNRVELHISWRRHEHFGLVDDKAA